MRRSCLTRQLAVSVVALSMVFVASDLCLASGGGSWGGSWGGGYSSRGYGGSWGSCRGGFPTPVRNFFAYHQPVRRVVRGVGSAFRYRGCYGSRGYGWGCNGGYGSAGYGSTGYRYYSSTGYSVTGGSLYGGSTGFVHAPVATCGCATVAPACHDCAGTWSGGLAPTSFDSTTTGGPVPGAVDGTISNSNGLIPAEEYYDEGSGLQAQPSEGSELRGFETPPTPEPEGGEETTMRLREDAILNVSVPVGAKVLINDHLTKTDGAFRSYVSRQLKKGKDYAFKIEASIERDGRQINLKRDVVIHAGDTRTVDFDFESPMLTQVTVKVPENADVKLCGNDTTVEGSVRSFRTKLKPGQVWTDYDIVISYEQDGQIVRKQRTIDIEAGQKYVVDFDEASDLYVSK